jgi:WD40 repeat protein
LSAIRGDGKRVVIAGANGRSLLKLIDVGEGRRYQRADIAGRVTALAFAPDGSTFAAGMESGAIEVRSADDGRKLYNLSRHKSQVLQLAYTRDGRQLISIGANGALVRWDLAARKPVQVVAQPPGKGEEFEAVAISTDGAWLVSCSSTADRSVGWTRVWRTGTRAPVRQFRSEVVGSIAISGDGRWIALGTPESTVSLLAVDTGVQMSRSKADGEVTSLAFSPDSRLLAVGSRVDPDASRGGLQVISAEAGETLWRSSERFEFLESPAFTADSRLLAAMCDVHPRIWNAATGQEAWTLAGVAESRKPIAFSPDSRLLAVATAAYRILVWDTATWTAAAPFVARCQFGLAVEFSRDGRWLVAADRCATTVWDVATRKPVRTLNMDQVQSLDVSPDDKLLAWSEDATGYPDTLEWKAHISDLQTGEERVAALPPIPPTGVPFGYVKFTGSGDLITTGFQTLALRNALTGEVRWAARVETANAPVLLGSDLVLDSTPSHEIQIRSPRDGALVRSFRPSPNFTVLTASLDGRWIAAGGYEVEDGHIAEDKPILFVMNAATGEVVRKVADPTRKEKGKFEDVTALVFSPDGHWLVSGTQRGTVRVWDISDLRRD